MTFFSTHRSSANPSSVVSAQVVPAAWPRSGAFTVLFLMLTCQLTGCKKPVEKSGPEPVARATPAPSAVPSASSASPQAHFPEVKGHRLPVEPILIIEPGKGANAIRFGTNLKNLERHMLGPCDIKTETRCVYIKAAAEFTLTDGVVSGMKFHRRDRKVSEPKAGGELYFGSFNGGMRPDVRLGLFQHVAIKEYGEPLKKEPLAGPDGQVERHVYDGVIFEYDQLENKNIVLSGIEVVPSKTTKKQ